MKKFFWLTSVALFLCALTLHTSAPVSAEQEGRRAHANTANGSSQEVDRTPPKVSILGVNSGDRVVAPAQVAPKIVATDETDPSPRIEAFLDGEPYQPGTPITGVGLHLLRATAFDAAGNPGTALPVAFEILARPMLEATAVIADLQCHEDAEGRAGIEATVLLASKQFPVKDLNLYTIYLWALNKNGMALNRQRIPIAGSVNPATRGYDYKQAQASYKNGYWTLRFRADLGDQAIIGCPAYLLLTGGGLRNQPNSFDFEAMTIAAIDPHPVKTLAGLGLMNQDPPGLPPLEPACPSCEWKSRLIEGPADGTLRYKKVNCWPNREQVSYKLVWAKGGKLGGEAEAYDECTGRAIDAASATGNASLLVWLEGPEQCCECEITCIVTPKFKSRAEVNPPAEAIAAGMIDIASDCGCNTRAIGGAQAGQNQPVTVTFGSGATVSAKEGPGANASISTALTWTGGDVTEQPLTGNALNTVNKCMAVFSVVSSAQLKVMADADATNWYAHALARLWEATPGIRVEARCKAKTGPCAGKSKIIEYK